MNQPNTWKSLPGHANILKIAGKTYIAQRIEPGRYLLFRVAELIGTAPTSMAAADLAIADSAAKAA